MTLFAFANESLTSIAKIAAEGGNPADLYQTWRVLTILKEVDVIPLPSDFVEGLIRELYVADKESVLLKFRELGASVVGLLKIAADDIESLTTLAKDFSAIIPIKLFSMSEKQNGAIEVDVVGAGKGVETTECSSEFLKSILNGYGYSVTREELNRGAIRLWAQKRNWTPKGLEK